MKPHKYHAKATICRQGHGHPSKREATRCDELHMLLRAGAITALVYEPQYYFEVNGEPIKHPNGRRVGYKPDFSYIERGKVVAEEVKPASRSARSKDYALRIAVARALFPEIEFREVA